MLMLSMFKFAIADLAKYISVAHNNTSTQCSLPANSSLTVLELCEPLQK